MTSSKLLSVLLICVLMASESNMQRPSLGLICASRRDCRIVPRGVTIDNKFTISPDKTPLDLIKNTCTIFIENNVNAILFINSNTDLYEVNRMLVYRYLLSLTNTLGIPLMGWNPAVTKTHVPGENSNFLQLVPSMDNQCETMFDLLKRYSWKSFAIVTTSTDGHKDFVSCLRRNVEDNEKQGFKILGLVKILQHDSASIHEKLSHIPEETRIILMHATLEESYLIFNATKDLGLSTSDHQWILTKDSIGYTEYKGCTPGKNCDFPDGCLGVSYKTKRADYQEIIRKANTVYNRAKYKFKPMAESKGISLTPRVDINCSDPNSFSTKWKGGELFYQFLRNVTIEGGPKDLKLQFTENGLMKESEMTIVNFNQNTGEWKAVGKWNPQTKITMDQIKWPGNSLLPPRDRPEKWKLRIVTLEEEPYIITSDVDNKTGECKRESMVKARWEPKPGVVRPVNGTLSPDEYIYKCLSGFAIDLLHRLEKDIGFEYEMFRVEDNMWGDNGTGEWNGPIRTLMDHKADMCLTSLKINNDRNDAVAFSLPFLETGITIIVGIKKGVISPTAFLEPFELLIWLFILLFWITVVSVTVFTFEWVSPFGYNRKIKPPKEPYDFSAWCLILVFSVHAVGTAIFVFEWLSPRGLDRGNSHSRDHKFSLFRSFWLIWAMLFGAAVDTDTPKGVASRFMGSVWALFALVFLASYTANLAAFMIAKEDFFKLQGLQDPKLQFPTATKPAFRYGTLSSGNTANVLRNNHKRLYTYMKSKNFLTADKKDAIDMIRNNQLDAFIYDATVLEYMAGKDKDCKLRTVGNWYAMTGYGIAFPKDDAKWLPKFNEQLIRYQKEGVLEKLQHYWMAGACKTGKTTKGNESSHPLGIINFTSAYYLLAGGVLLAILLMLLEHSYFKFVRRKLKKWDKCGCCGLISLSMGRSLTFEQSVMEMLDVKKNFKCKNALCETQMWKVKHELDIALVRIDRLQNRLRDLGYKAIPKSPSLKNSMNDIYDRKAIGWKNSQEPSPSSETTNECKNNEPSQETRSDTANSSNSLLPPRTNTPPQNTSTKSKSPNQIRLRFVDEDRNGNKAHSSSPSQRLKNVSGKTYLGVPVVCPETEKLESIESTL